MTRQSQYFTAVVFPIVMNIGSLLKHSSYSSNWSVATAKFQLWVERDTRELFWKKGTVLGRICTYARNIPLTLFNAWWSNWANWHAEQEKWLCHLDSCSSFHGKKDRSLSTFLRLKSVDEKQMSHRSSLSPTSFR